MMKQKLTIVKISCGGMHTLALSNSGLVYSWGCNDDAALGRPGPENAPALVADSLIGEVTDIATGDCHSIAYNTETNSIYFWGCYRNIVDGKTSAKVDKPEPFASDILNQTSESLIKKIDCGA